MSDWIYQRKKFVLKTSFKPKSLAHSNFHFIYFAILRNIRRWKMFLLLLFFCFHSAIHIYDNNNTFYSVCNRHSRFSMNKQKRKNQIHLQVLISAKISFREEIKRGRSKEIEISFLTMTSKKWLPQVKLIKSNSSTKIKVLVRSIIFISTFNVTYTIPI